MNNVVEFPVKKPTRVCGFDSLEDAMEHYEAMQELGRLLEGREK